MKTSVFRCVVLVAAVLCGSALATFAQAPHDHGEAVNDPCLGTVDKADLEKVHPTKPPYSPYAGRNFPERPFFGDTHLHTSFSMDAGAFGARLTPRDAY